MGATRVRSCSNPIVQMRVSAATANWAELVSCSRTIKAATRSVQPATKSSRS